MATWTGKSKGSTWGYRFFIGLIKYRIGLAYFFLLPVALYYLIFSNKKPSKFFFGKILGYDKSRTYLSIYRNYVLLGQILIDKIAFLSGLKDKYTFDFDGEEHLHNMAQKGNGGLLIGAHMGNWEVAGQLLERIDTRINIVMFEAEHEKIKAMLDDAMVEKNVRVIPIKDDFSHLFSIKEAFDNNEIVAMHGDRYLPGTNTITVDFIGKAAKFPSGPLYLASKHKVPVSFVYTLKETSRHYHFFATKGKTYNYPGNLKTRKQEIKNMVKDYVEVLEQMVRKYPLQWFNYFPFWDEENSDKKHNLKG